MIDVDKPYMWLALHTPDSSPGAPIHPLNPGIRSTLWSIDCFPPLAHPYTSSVMSPPNRCNQRVRNTRAKLLPAMLIAATGVAHGAPTSSTEELNPGVSKAADGSVAMPGVLPQTPAAGVQQSKTVELLLQLQDKPNAGIAVEKPASGAVGVRRVAAQAAAPGAAAAIVEPAASNPFANLKAAILPGVGSQATGEVRETRPGFESRSETASSFQAPGASPGTEPRESRLLNNPVVRFIRENRWTVLGVAVAVLVAIGLSASASMRRGR